MKYLIKFTAHCVLIALVAVLFTAVTPGGWQTVETEGKPQKRHEAGFVEFEGKFYLIGGRGAKPVSVYDPETGKWVNKSRPPMQIHHFQPVVFEDAIYLICAMTGGFPNETGLPNVMLYYPNEDRWETGHEIPEDRRRGSAGAVLRDGKIYLVGGIVRGHMGGYVAWFDEYDPKTGEWRTLPDAPHKRDHHQVTMLGDRLYSAGGRQTSRETGELFSRTIAEVDVYDFGTGQWSVLQHPLPTPRAGNSTFTLRDEVVVLGGESGDQRTAHDEMEAYSETRETWRDLPALVKGRHGTGAILFNDFVYTCSGSGGRGGGPELETLERITIEQASRGAE